MSLSLSLSENFGLRPKFWLSERLKSTVRWHIVVVFVVRRVQRSARNVSCWCKRQIARRRSWQPDRRLFATATLHYCTHDLFSGQRQTARRLTTVQRIVQHVRALLAMFSSAASHWWRRQRGILETSPSPKGNSKVSLKKTASKKCGFWCTKCSKIYLQASSF